MLLPKREGAVGNKQEPGSFFWGDEAAEANPPR